MTKRTVLRVALGIAVIIWAGAQMKPGVSQIAEVQEQQPLTEGVPIPGTDPGQSARVPRTAATGGLNASNSVAVVPIGTRQCRAFAPANWSVAAITDRGDVAEFMSGDGQSYASWSIRGVNRAMEPYYGPVYGDPIASSRFLVEKAAESMGDRSRFSPVSAASEFGNGFTAQEFRSQASKALVVFRLYPAPGMFPRGSYIISLRIAITPLAANAFALKTAAGVAGSISCETMFVPPVNNDVPLPRPGDPTDARRKREADQLADYNVQLGTQTFHSPTTGENILVDPSTATTNGPQGQGVYGKSGNTLELLVPGRSQ